MAAVREQLQATGEFTADTVAERADCSPATFYGHFATKDDALTAAFELVLIEMFEMLRDTVTAERIERGETELMIGDFVTVQARVFRVDSLVFRAALARLPFHKNLRRLYREAERVSLEHLALTLGDKAIAERFLVMSQGLNNPRALPPKAGHIRQAYVGSLIGMVSESSRSKDL